MRVQVLGEVCAWRDGEPIALGPASRRAMLGLLALAGGHPLPRTELVAGIWHGRQPPPSAVNILHTHVKHLRRLLEPQRPAGAEATIVRRVGDGYALHVPGAAVDAVQFRADVITAATLSREGRLNEAIAALERALGRWQGPVLADVPALAGHPKLVALTEERQSALAKYADLMIDAGRAADILAALEEEAAARPLDEATQARLILAYRDVGRRDRAFETFHLVRRRLADDLGVDPGPELAAVHGELLHDDRPAAPAGVPPHPVTPAQLIGDLPAFTGRAPELSLLDSLLLSPASVAVVSGAAGMGKTSLAVHWAHRAAHHFPDGQLYVNLRGFHPGGAPMDPAEALRRFLDALGVAAAQIPSDLDALAALYRSKLAGKQVLVLLDNAADVAQVRPLLPGKGSSLALVTSRNQLAGLVATAGARLVALHPLTPDEAHHLLAQRIGPERAGSEPEAIAEIVKQCAGLPLALAISAARAVVGGHPLDGYADELRAAGGQLDALALGDADNDLREVFSWSYRALGDLPAKLFRLLGIHPGPDLSVAAAASLAGRPLHETRAALRQLVSASLLLTPTPGRYAMHDLVRAYAGELAHQTDPRSDHLREASRRMLAHYVHTGYAADRLLNPARATIALDPAPAGVLPEALADVPRALAWFTTEHPVLLAVHDHAVAVGLDTETWQLTWTLWTYLDRQGHWHELTAASHAAIAAAGRAAGPAAQAEAHRLLARAHTRLNQLADAQTHLQHALDLYEGVGDHTGKAHTHLNAALVRERQNDPGTALVHAKMALDLFTTQRDRTGQVRSHNAAGWYYALLGDHPQAQAHCQAALANQDAFGDRRECAPIWDTLGYSHHKLGDHTQAVACFQRAVDLYAELGDRHIEGLALTHLAEAQQSGGNTQAARATYHQALAILTDLDPPAAEQVRAALAALPATG